MNDYCCNQNQGLKARQHTSTHLFHWVSCHKLSTTFPTPSPPHPPAPGGCMSHKQKNETWLLVVVQFYPRLIFYLPWEQWFLHSRCYATKREKPLQATVHGACMSKWCYLKMSRHFLLFRAKHYESKYPTTRWQRDRQQNNSFNKQNNNLHMQHNVLCIPLLFLHDYDVKMHNFKMHNVLKIT